jgi:hypothetical protein
MAMRRIGEGKEGKIRSNNECIGNLSFTGGKFSWEADIRKRCDGGKKEKWKNSTRK